MGLMEDRQTWYYMIEQVSVECRKLSENYFGSGFTTV